MTNLDHTKIQDKISGAKQPWLSKKGAKALKQPTREKVLGLKYERGQKVLDTITGEEVTILGGTRETIAFPATGGSGG